ncbi:O-antigen ligase family protein [Microbacterium sp.]|uniref:O-antigen ligase family protein n=1 Tax=Microbacterium sp. TaxID=51671 RepID=UPI002FE16A01
MEWHATVVVFSAFAYSFWFNLIGAEGAGALLIALTLVTLTVWIPPRFRRRGGLLTAGTAPWAVFAYAGLALLSAFWSHWPGVSALTLLLFASATVHGLFLVDRFEGRELIAIAGRALRAVVILSLVMELWVAVVRRAPLMPNFADAPSDPDPHWYWVRGNLLDGFLSGGRAQGAVGNANLLGVLCLLTALVCIVQLLAGQGSRLYLAAVATVSVWLIIRTGSATVLVALVVVVATAAFVIAFRSIRSRRGRALMSAGLGAVAALSVALVILFREPLTHLLGRQGTFTGRVNIWEAVLERAGQSPVIGHGFATPWLPWDPAFDGWIVDHSIVVFQAHNMWLDVYLQLGAFGVFCLTAVALQALLKSWKLAVAVRSPVALFPLMVVVVLLIQGMTESTPLMLWGWLAFTTCATTIGSPRGPYARVIAKEETFTYSADAGRVPSPSTR